MPDALPWRRLLGDCLDDTAPDSELVSGEEAGIDLDDLAAPPEPAVRSIPYLAASKAVTADSSRVKRLVDALATQDTQTLILRIGLATDPLTLWELHRELDRREIEPCLRWPYNSGDAQMRFVTVMADLLWFTTRHANHAPAFKNWQRLFKLTPGSDQWLDTAFYLWRYLPQDNLSRGASRALALSPAHRQALMMFPTAPMVKQRRQLEPDRFAEIRVTLQSAALANKYRPKDSKTDDLANHRARLWRVYVLLGRRPEATAQAWALMTGETRSRQAISKQIATVKTALKKQRE